VYDFITLVSEVSGFADLLIVGSTFLMSVFISAGAFESRIIQYLGPITVAPKKRRQVPREAKDLTGSLSK
jgi:hypothetical protein